MKHTGRVRASKADRRWGRQPLRHPQPARTSMQTAARTALLPNHVHHSAAAPAASLTWRALRGAAVGGSPADDADLAVVCRAAAVHEEWAARVSGAEAVTTVWVVLCWGARERCMGGGRWVGAGHQRPCISDWPVELAMHTRRSSAGRIGRLPVGPSPA